MPLNDQHFTVIDLPEPATEVLDEFELLPLDPFCKFNQRYRRFSQYRMSFTDGAWRLTLLPHRPFIQHKDDNTLVGGTAREFEPLRIDPTPEVAAGADAIPLDRAHDWQINVHQCRVITNDTIKGVSVPEGPHRDGHEYGMLAIFARENISGAVNQLMPTGGGEPFYTDVIPAGKALIFDDTKLWHHATDIEPLDSRGGHRDMWIIIFNRWDRRNYGEEFEERTIVEAGATAGA